MLTVVRALVQPDSSAGAKLVVEHDGAAGGVVWDVRAHRLTRGGSHRCTVRGRIVEVGLEHAEIRRLALGGGDVEAVAITAQAGKLGRERELGVLVVASEVVRVRGRRIEDEEPVHGANGKAAPSEPTGRAPVTRSRRDEPALRCGPSARGRRSTQAI